MSGTVCLQSSMRGWAREVGEVTTSRRGRGGDAAPRGVVTCVRGPVAVGTDRFKAFEELACGTRLSGYGPCVVW